MNFFFKLVFMLFVVHFCRTYISHT